MTDEWTEERIDAVVAEATDVATQGEAMAGSDDPLKGYDINDYLEHTESSASLLKKLCEVIHALRAPKGTP